MKGGRTAIARAALLLLAGCAPHHRSTPPAPGARPPSELVESGKLAERVSKLPADLVLFYGGELRGSLETCGCPKRPMGSLARVASYVAAEREAWPGTPSVLVDGGYFSADDMGLDGRLRPDAPVSNRWVVAGMSAAGYQAANVAYEDLPAIEALPRLPPWLVSANVRAAGGAPAPAPRLLLQAGDLRVGITGITAPGVTFVPATEHRVEDPYESAVRELHELAGVADVLVLLAYDAPEIARRVAEAVPELDVVVDTAMHRDPTGTPGRVGGAVWVRSQFQTARLGELRLRVRDRSVQVVADRMIDLDPELPDDPRIARLQRAARAELEAVQARVFGP